jgi:hypothetical protein
MAILLIAISYNKMLPTFSAESFFLVQQALLVQSRLNP